MEGRRVFAELTIDENLQTGAFTNKDKRSVKDAYDRAMELFPILSERRSHIAGYLSGGEQQMPILVEQIRDIIAGINDSGVSVLLIEQNAAMALSIADYGYIMENGQIVLDGEADDLRNNADVQEFYLGLHTDESGERKSFRDLR